MEQRQASVILQSFEQHRVAVTASSHTWKWASGVILFPESFCPWCGQAMISTRIWRIDALRLVGQYKLDGSKLKFEKPYHPHVDGRNNGAICMRTASDAFQALFLAWNKESMYWGARAGPLDVERYQKMAKTDYLYADYAKLATKWRNWLADTWAHSCGSEVVSGGLTAELSRSAAKERLNAEMASAVRAQAKKAEVANPADNEPIFSIRLEPF